MPVQGVHERACSELGSSVRVHDASGHVTTPDHGVVQGVYREACLHPVADRVADDPAGEYVFDRAEVELALVGPMLRDVGQP